MRSHRKAFTIIELLVVVSIIALLVGILLPAIGKARDQAKLTISQANLRNLGTAHGSYAAEYGDRQLTFIDDSASSYGTYGTWWRDYNAEHGSDGSWGHPGNHPGVVLGWGHADGNGVYRLFTYEVVQPANAGIVVPINWEAPGTAGVEYFGSFRLPNAAQFNSFVSGKFYDKTFYAPKDTAPWASAEPCFESPDEFCDLAEVGGIGAVPAWSSYCMSPAAMFNPEVMAHQDNDDSTRADGWRDPWELPGGMRSPSMSQAQYPNLKTHMLEHHWLQNTAADCNPGFDPGTYVAGCEPYYFNHAWESSPVALFYDGHVESVGTRSAMRADGRVRAQTRQEEWGLWNKDTPWGEDGYLSEYGYDQAETSYHILTTNGIRGRDVAGD